MLVVVLKLLDQIAVKCVKAHFNVWQVTQRQLFNPTGDLTKLCNSCVLLLLVQIRIKIIQAFHCSLTFHCPVNGIEYFWEFVSILFKDFKAFMRVFPVLSDMSSSSGMFIMIKVI